MLDLYRAALDRPDAALGTVAAMHTFGELDHWHPHVHALVTDGAFAPDGSVILRLSIETAPLHKQRRKLVFDLLLAQGKIHEDLVGRTPDARHSGFGSLDGVYLETGDTADAIETVTEPPGAGRW